LIYATLKFTYLLTYQHPVNPLKPSGAKWLHLKASMAILV